MKVKRPSTSPGALQTSCGDFSIGLLSTSPSTVTAGLPSRGSTFTRFARPATSHSTLPRFHRPWEISEPPLQQFDEDSPPSTAQLEQAAKCMVVGESGVRVAFGSLWQHQKTIVIFIRHFLCPMCQDYVVSIVRGVAPAVLRREGIRLVIISNGHHDFIKSYRKVLKCPYEIYTDPKSEIYSVLGMTLHSMEKGPRPSYIRHGVMGGVGMVISNAVKSRMPIWKHGGDISQLGGEFVLGPGIQCSFSHRMRYVRSHLPIHKVVQAATAEPEAPKLPEILVIGNDFASNNGRFGFSSSRTSVLEVFHRDHQDEDVDFTSLKPIKSKKNPWNLPSTRRSWIIQEVGENEEEAESSSKGHKRNLKSDSEPKNDDLEASIQAIQSETTVESQSQTTMESDTAVESELDQETEKKTRAAAVRDTDHPDEMFIPAMTSVDWRKVKRGSLQWRRARSSTCSSSRSEGSASVDLQDSSQLGSTPFRKDSEITSGKPRPYQTIPKDISPSDIGRDSARFSAFGNNSFGTRTRTSFDSLSTLTEEAQVRQAFVLKLLPALDLDISFKFDEFPWIEENERSCGPSRRSSLQSLQLDPHFLTSSKNHSVMSVRGGTLIPPDVWT